MKCYRQSVGVAAKKPETQILYENFTRSISKLKAFLRDSYSVDSFSVRKPFLRHKNADSYSVDLKPPLRDSFSVRKPFLRRKNAVDLSEPFFLERFWEEITE